MRTFGAAAAVFALLAPVAARAAGGATVLHPGQSKSVGKYTVVCTTAHLKATKTRVVLHPGYQVKVAGRLFICKRAASSPTPTPVPTPAPAPPPPPGTRANPYPLGATVTVPNWSVRVNGVKFNDWSDVQAANMFNDPPAPGWEDVVINATMTYTGATSGTPWLDFEMNYVGASNVAYPLSGFDHYCGVPPSPELSDYNTVFPGGTVTGNACFQIQVADEASLVGVWNDPLRSGGLGPYFSLR